MYIIFSINELIYSFVQLKNNIELDNILHKLWKESSVFRLSKENNINMLSTYLALSKPTGHILVSIVGYVGIL